MLRLFLTHDLPISSDSVPLKNLSQIRGPLHTDHSEIQIRLGLWQAVFETGVGTCPVDAVDGDYEIDSLLYLARVTEIAELLSLADSVETQMHEYNDRLHELEEAINCVGIGGIGTRWKDFV